DGVETLFEAMASGDSFGFYSVNLTYGEPRGEAFTKAISQFVEFVDAHRIEVQTQVERSTFIQMIAIGAALGVGLLLVILARIFLGRVVLRPLAEVGEHFDRMAEGDLTSRVNVRNDRNEITALLNALKRM